MSTTTALLNLTLPELNEFVNSWNGPVNQNFEDIDDFLDDLKKSLLTSSATSTWAALRGSKNSLAERLDVSINADGTIDVSSSADIVDMSTSAVRGAFTNPRDRINDGDFQIYDARQPVADGRFVPIGASGPSAAYPPEEIDAGVALRSADFGAGSSNPISSPRTPWAPGLVTGGAVPMMAAQAIGTVRLSADTIPAVFNIDGYIFRIREIIDFDWTLLAPADNAYVWIYVERVEGSYASASFKYDGVGGGGTAVKDLRKLQSGSAGVSSGSVFTDAAALFNTNPLGKVKTGDVLVIESGAAAGDYVIDALDGTTPDTKLTIKGKFKADLGGLPWHIQDDAHPNIGAVVTDLTTTTQPPFVAGRVYIGRAKHRTASNPEEVITFTRGGVFDSGWATPIDAGADFPKTFIHNLGQLPTDVQVWFRASATDRAYEPKVERQLLTNFDEGNTTVDAGDAKKDTFLLPSVRTHVSNTDLTVALLNASADPAKPSALFTDSGGTDVAVGEMRVIARL